MLAFQWICAVLLIVNLGMTLEKVGKPVKAPKHATYQPRELLIGLIVVALWACSGAFDLIVGWPN